MTEYIAVDIGNSRTTCALFRRGDLLEKWHNRTDEFDKIVVAIVKRIGVADRPHLVAISSAIPILKEQLLESLEDFGARTIEVSIENQRIISNTYSDMGTDRLANAVAALRSYMGRSDAAIVIDFGAATTLTAVDKHGSFRGGLITLGLRSTLRSLHNDLSQLPDINPDPPRVLNVLAQSTGDAILSGTIFAQAGAVTEWVTLFEDELGGKVSVILTGGQSRFISPYLRITHRIDEDLTLTGIRLLAEDSDLVNSGVK